MYKLCFWIYSLVPGGKKLLRHILSVLLKNLKMKWNKQPNKNSVIITTVTNSLTIHAQ